MLKSLLSKTGYAALRMGLRASDLPLMDRFVEQGNLIDLLRDLRINYVLDVGANKCWFANHLRMLGYWGAIFCFEPIRADCLAISRLAGNDCSWRIFNFGLGSENTTKSFNIISLSNGNTTLSSFLKPRVESQNLTGKLDSSTSEPIAIKSLDEVLDEAIPQTSDCRCSFKMA